VKLFQLRWTPRHSIYCHHIGRPTTRLEEERRDEIGQLQQMLNHTAEEVRKRESIKDLMGKYLSKQVAYRIMDGIKWAGVIQARHSPGFTGQ